MFDANKRMAKLLKEFWGRGGEPLISSCLGPSWVMVPLGFRSLERGRGDPAGNWSLPALEALWRMVLFIYSRRSVHTFLSISHQLPLVNISELKNHRIPRFPTFKVRNFEIPQNQIRIASAKIRHFKTASINISKLKKSNSEKSKCRSAHIPTLPTFENLSFPNIICFKWIGTFLCSWSNSTEIKGAKVK